MTSLRAVINTNVVFEGLTSQGGASGLIIDAWLARLFIPCISNALAYEYIDVLSRKLNSNRWQQIKPVINILLSEADFISIYYLWRPTSPDPTDEHLIDCAMNSGAFLVTWNLKDFKLARTSLGLQVMSPIEFLNILSEQE